MVYGGIWWHMVAYGGKNPSKIPQKSLKNPSKSLKSRKSSVPKHVPSPGNMHYGQKLNGFGRFTTSSPMHRRHVDSQHRHHLRWSSFMLSKIREIVLKKVDVKTLVPSIWQKDPGFRRVLTSSFDRTFQNFLKIFSG